VSERWRALPLWSRVLATLGAMCVFLALVMLPGSLATDDEAAVLAERGVETTATSVRVHVGNAYRLDGVEVTFTTVTGENVTTMLAGVVGHGVNRPTGWQRPGPKTGYEEPLWIRYDPRDPSLVMAVSDYADYRDFAFWVFDLVLLAAGLVMLFPAAMRL
jgi:hypothetical protein